MRPSELLDAIGDLDARLDTSENFQHNVRYMVAHHMGRVDLSRSKRDEVDPKILAGYRDTPLMLRRHLKVGDPYRVSHDMCQMVEWMATQLDGTDRVMRALAPSEAAVVCFDKPLPVRDIRGKTMLLHWLVWGPGQFGTDGGRGLGFPDRTEPGTMMWCFNDTWRQPDEVQQMFEADFRDDPTEGGTPEERARKWDNYQKMIGRWATIGIDIVFDQQRVGPILWTPGEDQAASVLAEGHVPTQGMNVTRYLLALWMLLGQTITTATEDTPDRPSRRRALKRGLPAKVTVIKLRREDKPTLAEGETQVEWSHRWMVKRHPRWQPYGHRSCASEAGHHYGRVEVEIAHRGHGKVLVKRCIHCDAYVARIFIEAYEKGPEGAPLVISEKVYDLTR